MILYTQHSVTVNHAIHTLYYHCGFHHQSRLCRKQIKTTNYKVKKSLQQKNNMRVFKNECIVFSSRKRDCVYLQVLYSPSVCLLTIFGYGKCLYMYNVHLYVV